MIRKSLSEIEKELTNLDNQVVRITTRAEDRQKALDSLRQECRDLGLDPDNLDTEFQRLEQEQLKLEETLVAAVEDLRILIKEYEQLLA